MKYLKYVLFLAIVALLIGCEEQQTQYQGVQQSSETGDQPETSSNSGSMVADASEQFKNLLGSKSRLEWKIDYNVATKAQGVSLQTSMTQFVKGTTKARTDVTAQGIDSRTYLVDNVLTICTKSGANWNCLKSDVKQDNIQESENDIQENTDDYTIVSDGTKTVAGTTANCFKVVGNTNGIDARYCFSNDGVPLYVNVKGRADGQDFSTEMTATSFSRSASESDFVPPAAEQTMPAMPTGQATGQNPCAYCDMMSGEAKDECLASC